MTQHVQSYIPKRSINICLHKNLYMDGHSSIIHNSQKAEGFPGGAVVESLPANAGDTGLSPGLGGSHMPRSSWAREPQLLSLRVWCLCSATREAAIVRGPRTAMKSGPRLPRLEKALAQKRGPNTAINKKKKKKKSRNYLHFYQLMNK